MSEEAAPCSVPFDAERLRRFRSDQPELTCPVMFVDLCESTGYSTDEPPGLADLRVSEFINEVACPIVRGHGATLVKSTGDGIMAVFEPTGSETPAGCQARASGSAAAIVQRLPHASDELHFHGRHAFRCRIGLAWGPLRKVKLADSPDALGEAANAAARVVGLAKPSQILAAWDLASRAMQAAPNALEASIVGRVSRWLEWATWCGMLRSEGTGRRGDGVEAVALPRHWTARSVRLRGFPHLILAHELDWDGRSRGIGSTWRRIAACLVLTLASVSAQLLILSLLDWFVCDWSTQRFPSYFPVLSPRAIWGVLACGIALFGLSSGQFHGLIRTGSASGQLSTHARPLDASTKRCTFFPVRALGWLTCAIRPLVCALTSLAFMTAHGLAIMKELLPLDRRLVLIIWLPMLLLFWLPALARRSASVLSGCTPVLMRYGAWVSLTAGGLLPSLFYLGLTTRVPDVLLKRSDTIRSMEGMSWHFFPLGTRGHDSVGWGIGQSPVPGILCRVKPVDIDVAVSEEQRNVEVLLAKSVIRAKGRVCVSTADLSFDPKEPSRVHERSPEFAEMARRGLTRARVYVLVNAPHVWNPLSWTPRCLQGFWWVQKSATVADAMGCRQLWTVYPCWFGQGGVGSRGRYRVVAMATATPLEQNMFLWAPPGQIPRVPNAIYSQPLDVRRED